MDMYDFALQMERDGEAYYRELAGRAGNAGFRTILTRLADEEVRHYHVFAQMKAGATVAVPPTDVLATVKNIFVQMRAAKEQPLGEGSEAGLYQKAREIEFRSRDFYLERAKDAPEERQRENFRLIAGEEIKHAAILDEIIAFVSQPEAWLEDSEWYHLEEY